MGVIVLALAKWHGRRIRVEGTVDGWGQLSAKLQVDDQVLDEGKADWLGQFPPLRGEIRTPARLCARATCRNPNREAAQYCSLCGEAIPERSVAVLAYIEPGLTKTKCKVEVDGEWVTEDA